MSPPEAMLWAELRRSKQGFKVRRQHPIGPYVADFFVRDANLVIEVDGRRTTSVIGLAATQSGIDT